MKPKSPLDTALDSRELLDVAGKPRKKIWQNFTRANSFVFDPKVLKTLATFCGLDYFRSQEDKQRRAAFEVDLNEAARGALGVMILDLGRPSQYELKQSAETILKAAKKLRDELRKNLWELMVNGIIPSFSDQQNKKSLNSKDQLEDQLSWLISNAGKAIKKHQRGKKTRHYATVPLRAFAKIFDDHVLIPPEGYSPRCSEATEMENIKAVRRAFVKTALSHLDISFTRPLQSTLGKIPISDEAHQRILQQTY